MVIEVVRRPNFMQKKIRKKYRTVWAVGPEHKYVRMYTHARECIYRFLPESKDIRGTNYHANNPKNWLLTVRVQCYFYPADCKGGGHMAPLENP